ncbi:hypothetical protein [Nocardia wallacei]|uniref:HORMA-1 domain-containing protein n=1 Tax=Nocardia wallacei TaxID=480035 RepID=UPI002457C4D8|nr:hypothetical protein [Nocardia wallacei]
MTTSYTTTTTETFSKASARYIASKIATDLRQLQRYYDAPTDSEIDSYAEEATVLSQHSCIEKVLYGFQRSGSWILTP